MINKLIEIDKEIFLYLNGINNHSLDPLMLVLSSSLGWSFVLILLSVLVYMYSDKAKLYHSVALLLSVGLTAALTNALKIVVQRPRPIHYEEWSGVIHDIEKYSAAYSFFSSHASTTFCMAMFTFLVLKKQKFIGVIALVWALGVSYSRIYVGKHFPGDVAVGITFGIFMAFVSYFLLQKFLKRKTL